MAYHHGGYHGQKRPGGQRPQLTEGEEMRRIRMPGPGEVLGIVLGLMGSSRMKVMCKDGKERMARIPGKMRNKIWVREGDVVVVRPYEIQGDTKGDIIWRYNPMQAKILKERGEINL